MERNRTLIDKIEHTKGGLAEYIGVLGKKTENAFKEKPKACMCCDGRINAPTAIGESAVRLPGVIALQDRMRWAWTAAYLREAGIKRIYSHDDCGAMAVAAKDFGITGIEEVNAFARKQTEEFCAEYGKGDFEYAGHIGKNQMETTGDLHPELCFWYDMTGRFEQAQLEGSLPQGFVLSVTFADNPIPSMKGLLKITFGAHGAFGENELGKKNTDRKFNIFIIAPDTIELGGAATEVQNGVNETPWTERIIVSGVKITLPSVKK